MIRIITVIAITVLTLSCKKNTGKEITFDINNSNDVHFSWRTTDNANTINKKKLYVDPSTVIMYYYQSESQSTFTMELNIFIDGVPHKRNPIVEDFSVYGGGEVFID